MEYIDLYDKHNNLVKTAVKRGIELSENEYFKVVHVWLKNKNHYLIQKRNKDNDKYPYMWATTSGSVLSKEDPLDAALREVREELGITLDPNTLSLEKIITSKRNNFHTICYVYFASIDVDIKKVSVDNDEVSDALYATLPTIKTMIKDNTFWDYAYLMDDPDYFKILESK